MNKKTLSIFLALVVSVCAGLSACADPPGIAQPYSGQPIAPAVSSAVETTVSSESVSSTTEETTISSAASEESAVTSEIEKTTPQESYTQPQDCSYQLNSDGTVAMSYGAILHAFCWSFETITENLQDIKDAGYTSIQTSPINNCKVGDSGKKALFSEDGGKWWYHYQPTDYVIGNYQLGSVDKFKKMCEEADKLGLKIIVDVPLNHVSSDVSVVSKNITELCDEPFHDRGEIGSYSSRKQVTQNDLLGLKDLNTQDPKIQEYIHEYLKTVIASGASGFRFDAAKHIELPDDDPEYASEFWPTVLENGAEFQYGEILQGECDRIEDYAKIMSVTASNYGKNIRMAALGNVSTSVVESYSAAGVDPSKFVTWVESHDNYCNDGSENETWAKLSEADVEVGWAIIAARSGGAPLFFSRPDGSTMDDPWGKNQIGKKGSDGFKSETVSALNHFRNEMAGTGETLSNPDADKKVLIIERGDKGAVIINKSGADYTLDGAQSVLKDGTYKDKLSDSEFTVSGGKISGTIANDAIVVIY